MVEKLRKSDICSQGFPYYLLFIFTIYMFWLVFIPLNVGPDEIMRYDIPRFIYDNNALPYGWEESIRNPIWGFSYAFTPYLSYIISALLMEVSSIFVVTEQTLLWTARFASVIFMLVNAVFVMKISRLIFERNKVIQWLFIILSTLMPLIVMLSSYVNNDTLAIASCTIIIYSWIRGMKDNWSKISCSYLVIGITLCALSYYNAYGYLFLTLVLFVIELVKRYKTSELLILFKKGLFIFLSCLLFAGWFFVRNYFAYDGDILGLQTQSEYSEMYAREDIKPSNHTNPQKEGYSISSFLGETMWVEQSYNSFIGINASISVVNFYSTIFVTGLLSFVYGLFKNKINMHKKILYSLLFVAFLLPIFASVFHSYGMGYQAQGRYFITSYIPLYIFICSGYLFISKALTKRSGTVNALFKVLSLLLILTAFYYTYESFIKLYF